ncbi:MAG: S41 family peptidase [Luteolibacter sp.]|uniref:S41 family peptidase n=2 Tax=Luteolibacter sp. TaxID=1962973 RepID=UPI0032665A58
MTAPAVSADGKSMVFEWINDLWTASTDGGEAVCVEHNPARDTYPQFTPNGKRIVFSSGRTGSMQIFSIPAGGGEAIQHTHQTQGNELECLSPDGSHAITRGIRERSGFRATSLFTINLTTEEREQRLFDATGDEASWSPDGTRVLFSTGGEQLYRKGYKGSRASQIWQYEISTGRFECKVAEETDARTPVWQADGKGFYYLSSRTGTLNLWSQSGDSAAPVAITRETGDGVFSRMPSADGSTFVFRRGFGLFRLRPKTDTTPLPLTLWTREKLPDVSRDRKKITSAASADFTADLDQVVFAAAGELWWMKRSGETKRLTETAAAEGDVKFSPDGQWLYFLRDDGLTPNYFRAELKESSLANEQQITRDSFTKIDLKPSPDGKKIAWVEGTGNVFAAAADGSDPHLVFKCWDRPTFDWHPGGQWLAIAAEDQNSNRDIWLGDADGKLAPLNLTRNPAFEGSPRWSPDGKWLAFSAKRNAGGISQLWGMEFGAKGIPADKARIISTGDIEPTQVIWAANSESLLFQNQKLSDPNLYSISAAGGDVKTLTAQRGVPIRTLKEGSLLWRVDQTPAIFKDANSVKFPISASIDRPRSEVLTLAFRRIWKTLGERFYDPTMNSTDWEARRIKYEPAAAQSRTSRQFDRTVSQLFGELNASHLSFLRKPWPNEIVKAPKEEATAHPGLVFRDALSEGPLVIERVIHGSSVALIPDAPEPGETVVRIAGEAVTNHTPLHRFFNGGLDRTLPVVIRAKDGQDRVIELHCISYARARSLDRKEKETTAHNQVTKSGNFTYIPVHDMSMKTFTDLELTVYRASLDSAGMILDFRNNGGGREADRMLSLFCQPVHSFTVPRDGPEGYPVDQLVHAAWNKPLVVLCNENTFSNAEIFCHAMQETKRAPLVGMTTAGGVISAVKVTIPDAGKLQVPFRGWFQAGTRKNLDLNGALPDFQVKLTPADTDAGKDPQLEKALEVLLESTRGNR